jgi:hypothetical protein
LKRIFNGRFAKKIFTTAHANCSPEKLANTDQKRSNRGLLSFQTLHPALPGTAAIKLRSGAKFKKQNKMSRIWRHVDFLS